MLMQVLSQFRRRPIPALAVILFAVVISFALGGLQRSNDEERASYEAAYEMIPITFTVTNFRGQESTMVQGWIADIFIGTGVMEPTLDEFVDELRVELTHDIDGAYAGYELSGITSAVTAPLLDSACGGKVTWFDGYDESIFKRTFEEDDLLCVVSQSLYETLESGKKEIRLEFNAGSWNSLTGYDTVSRKLTIVGTYASVKPEYTIYCPYGVVRRLKAELGDSSTYVTGVTGILKDNRRLEEFRTAAANWFGEINPEGEETPWGKYGYEYYLYALDINDNVLQRVTRNYQISMVINRLSFALVFAFCTAAGFLIGFLLIRSRKREIGLMRTVGSSNVQIWLGYSIEQLLCAAAGIVIGGALMGFNAPKQLALFALVYFIGLSAAMIVFLNRNLLFSMKEEE